jgi:hypothetical protein
MTRRISLAPAAFVPAALALLFLSTGCALTVPASDPTPPDVRLTVSGVGNTFTLTPTSPNESRSASPGTEILLLAAAIDEDGGVQNVSISGALTVSCSGGDLGQAVSVHYVANNPEDPSVGVGDEALDRRLTTLELDTGTFANFCGNGFSFTGASGGFVAQGENFHGGTASTATFSLSVP